MRESAKELALMSNFELARTIAEDLFDGSFEGEAYSEQVVRNFVKPLERTAEKSQDSDTKQHNAGPTQMGGL